MLLEYQSSSSAALHLQYGAQACKAVKQRKMITGLSKIFLVKSLNNIKAFEYRIE
jgi:hypothetical protein